MLFTVSFRFMFCNAVSIDGCYKKEKAKLYFSSNQVSDYFHFICLFRYLKTEIINRNRDSGDWHLQIQQLVRAIPWRQSKGSKESHLEINRVVWSVIKKKGSRNNYQYYLILFTGFKRETTQDSDYYLGSEPIWRTRLKHLVFFNMTNEGVMLNWSW